MRWRGCGWTDLQGRPARRCSSGFLFPQVTSLQPGIVSASDEMIQKAIEEDYLAQVIVLPLALLDEIGQLGGQQLGRHDGQS